MQKPDEQSPAAQAAKPPLSRPELPRGFVDEDSAALFAREAVFAKIRRVYERYGFEPVETPFVEFTESLGKFLPDQDRPNAGVFSFKDDDEAWLSLRYDLTAPLARHFAGHYDRLAKPFRSYRFGHVFRNEKPGPGRFRQFLQFDADTVGSASSAADAEMVLMAADCFYALGLPVSTFTIALNNRKILDGVMENIGLGDAANAERRLIVLRAIDKLDRLARTGVAALLGGGRKDESGDFTKGAGLPDAAIATVLDFVEARAATGDETLARLGRVAAGSRIGEEGVGELAAIMDLVRASGYLPDGTPFTDVIALDPAVVRGLEYYTGPVFEATLALAPDSLGKGVAFGSVGGGGRYDGLVARFRAERVPATGFSIGVSRLLAALRAMESPLIPSGLRKGPVLVVVMDAGHLGHYQSLVMQLRARGIAAELYLGAGGLNAQLKYADRRFSPCAVIQGSSERAAVGGPQIAIRDLILGAALAKTSKDRADYLELREQAQFTVAEDRLVEAVSGVLARHTRAGPDALSASAEPA